MINAWSGFSAPSVVAVVISIVGKVSLTRKSFKLFYLSTTVLLSHVVSSQTKVSSAPLECLDVYYAYRLHAINFLKAMPIRISLRYLGTPDCILWSVRFFLTPWERDNIIIRNLVILQSDYMRMVFRLWHLPTAQVASVLAFFHFGTEQYFPNLQKLGSVVSCHIWPAPSSPNNRWWPTSSWGYRGRRQSWFLIRAIVRLSRHMH